MTASMSPASCSRDMRSISSLIWRTLPCTWRSASRISQAWSLRTVGSTASKSPRAKRLSVVVAIRSEREIAYAT